MPPSGAIARPESVVDLSYSSIIPSPSGCLMVTFSRTMTRQRCWWSRLTFGGRHWPLSMFTSPPPPRVVLPRNYAPDFTLSWRTVEIRWCLAWRDVVQSHLPWVRPPPHSHLPLWPRPTLTAEGSLLHVLSHGWLGGIDSRVRKEIFWDTFTNLLLCWGVFRRILSRGVSELRIRIRIRGYPHEFWHPQPNPQYSMRMSCGYLK